MTTEKVNDLTLVELKDYFSAKTFRLVPADVSTFGGITEVPVVINVHLEFSKKLNFNRSSLQTLFAFSQLSEKLIELNENRYTRKGTRHLKSISLNDCGELFTMVIDFLDKKSLLYSVKSEEVLDLLNNCRKPELLVEDIKLYS